MSFLKGMLLIFRFKRDCLWMLCRFPCVTATGENAMKFILSALGAVALLVGVAAAQPAEARCFWNGFALECFHQPHFGYGYMHRPWDRPYAERPFVEPYSRGW